MRDVNVVGGSTMEVVVTDVAKAQELRFSVLMVDLTFHH